MSDSKPVAILCAFGEYCLAHVTVLFLENLCSFLGEDWFEGSAHLDVGLQGLHVEVYLEGFVLEAMHVHDVLGNAEVLLVYLLVLNDEEQVKS